MMLDRMDEVQGKKDSLRPHLQEDEEYLDVFKNQGLGNTLNGSQMARLKKMFEEGNLESELQGSSIKDDIEDLYGVEMAESEYGQQATQEEMQKMMMQIQEHDDLDRDDREVVDE